MEHLEFTLDAQPDSAAQKRAYAVAGVVGSSDLEVLIAHGGTPGKCRVVVDTSAAGFGKIWQAVIEDANSKYPLAGKQISINDYSASPSTVSLRLAQAVEALSE